MTNNRGGRHVRIYEWDEVDIEEDNPEVIAQRKAEEKKRQAESKGLAGLFKRKLF